MFETKQSISVLAATLSLDYTCSNVMKQSERININMVLTKGGQKEAAYLTVYKELKKNMGKHLSQIKQK